MSPGMEGDEVSSHSHQGRSQAEKEQEKNGFPPFGFSRAGGQGQKEGQHEQALEKGRGGGGAGVGCHQEDDPPCFQGVEGKGGEHDPEAPTKTEQEPAEAGRETQGGIGRSPVPSSEQQKEQGGHEGGRFPDE